MPVDWKNYPPDWREISNRRKAAVEWKCELCHAEHGKPHWLTKSMVVLTVHHIDGDTKNNEDDNLLVCCQRCHLRLDRAKHSRNRRENKELAELRLIAGYIARKLGAMDECVIPADVIERMKELSGIKEGANV
jgi:5-methylcytosine-specific restriction endonuclease McrA